MSGKLCRTCRWWDSAGYSHDGYHVCNHPKIDVPFPMEERPRPSDGMTTSGQEYATNTGPDFGCVHWQKIADTADKPQE